MRARPGYRSTTFDGRLGLHLSHLGDISMSTGKHAIEWASRLFSNYDILRTDIWKDSNTGTENPPRPRIEGPVLGRWPFNHSRDNIADITQRVSTQDNGVLGHGLCVRIDILNAVLCMLFPFNILFFSKKWSILI